MSYQTETPEARTPTAIVVEETPLFTTVPMARLCKAHMPALDDTAVRMNENSETAYDITTVDNLTGASERMVGTFTVGAESETVKPTLGFNLEAFLLAVHGSNNPAMNKFMRAFADASIMRQMGASDEAIEAFHDENHIVSSKKTDADFKAWKATLQTSMVKPYSAVIKVYPQDA
jgi:hypothetical protein